MYRRSIDDPASFWGDVAKDFHWYQPWKKVVDWNVPDAKWFVDGTTNVCANCVDRQVENGHGDELAILWEGEPCSPDPEVRRLTYRDLLREVSP